MSGGYFDYRQTSIRLVQEDIEDILSGRAKEEYWDEEEQAYADDLRPLRDALPEKVLVEMGKAVEALKKAYAYAQRIDWLLSADDSVECFHERLKADLMEIGPEEAEDDPWQDWDGVIEIPKSKTKRYRLVPVGEEG